MSDRICRWLPFPRLHRFRVFEIKGLGFPTQYRLCTRCQRLWVGCYKSFRCDWPREYQVAGPDDRRAFSNASAGQVSQCGVGGLP